MGLTPMMQQYFQVKEKCKDSILFFRLGDFYEMFFEDAETASKELELVLTGRDCGLEQRAPMCGIPFHAANNYIGRLVNKGYKIAICEQLEDPSASKGIVKRDIIKIITPGTFTDSNFLEDYKNNYILSLYVDYTSLVTGMCFADISTGELYCTHFNSSSSLTIDEISKYNPSEIIIQEDIDTDLLRDITNKFNLTITKKNSLYYSDNAELNFSNQFDLLNNEKYVDAILYATNGLLNYVLETQKLSLSNITSFEQYNILDYMTMDINTRNNLELTENIKDKTKKGSLMWVINRTNTAMGSRMLRKWIEQPLINRSIIEDRLNAVGELKNNYISLLDFKELLKNVYDIERIIGKISTQSVNAKEMIALKSSISNIPKIKELLANFNSSELSFIRNNLDDLRDIYDVLDRAILESPALSIKEGNIIKDGFNTEIDELRKAKTHGKEWISNLENGEREITGIKSLKVGYNKVFGYYIEISKANYSSIPDGRYIRKQTLSNAERFITEELKEMEEKLLGAEEKLYALEYTIFVEIRNFVEENIERLKKCGRLLSELDCLISLAEVAAENNYCKPLINEEGYIKIDGGRHPVIEKVITKGDFITNDTYIDNRNDQMLIITGPNMAGKSTYMRQIALITILAQIGSFVPADSASISICDKIFTRIGASDDLFSGKSTFMVEMSEVANILSNATNNSLVLLDEVGRGTSTYDGLSIAWSVIEYICNNSDIKSKTLFATHYHELTKLEGIIGGVKNYRISVKEIENTIVFLRKIVRGGADESYGIEVAKLAGLPQAVIDRAKEILDDLEKDSQDGSKNDESQVTPIINPPKRTNAKTNNSVQQIGLLDLERDVFIKELCQLDILNITPMDAMNKLNELIKKAKSFS